MGKSKSKKNFQVPTFLDHSILRTTYNLKMMLKSAFALCLVAFAAICLATTTAWQIVDCNVHSDCETGQCCFKNGDGGHRHCVPAESLGMDSRCLDHWN